jgi:hypothetical protein
LLSELDTSQGAINARWQGSPGRVVDASRDGLKVPRRSADWFDVVGTLDVDERRALRAKARSSTLEALSELGGEARRSAVAERARAIGGFTARELEAPLPDGAATRYASPVDLALSWALTNLRKDGLVENPRRGFWRLTSVAAESGRTPPRGSIPPPGYVELASLIRGSVATPEPAPRRGLSRLWRVLAG